jgi:hypothetical protein
MPFAWRHSKKTHASRRRAGVAPLFAERLAVSPAFRRKACHRSHRRRCLWPKAAVQEDCAAAEGAAALRRHAGTGRRTKAPTARLIADQSRSGCVMSTSLDRGIHAQSIYLQESFHERLAQRGEQDNGLGPRPGRGGEQTPGCCASGRNHQADRRLLERHGDRTHAPQEKAEIWLSVALAGAGDSLTRPGLS